MARVAQHLLGRLHSVYDQAPWRTLALRLRHPTGLTWRLEAYTLTVTTPFGSTTFDIRAHTIGSLANALMASGHEIAFRNADLDHLSAILLLEGDGDQDRSNGDHLHAYTSILWTLLGGGGMGYEDARAAVPAALRQLILPQATHEWADLFGQIFGIPRDPGETDPVYTARIIWEVQRKRSNPFAISANIQYRTGHDIRVREPWQEIFVLSESPMDDDYHLQGAPIWQYHTAQLIASTGVNWGPVVREAMADRPAGTIFLDPATHYPPRGIEVGDIGLLAWQEPVRSGQIWLLNDGILSVNLDLSNYQAILNHPFLIYELVMLYCGPPTDVALWSNPDPAQALWLGNWDTRPWQALYEHVFWPPVNEYAGIIMLSDGVPLGDLQCHFAGSMPVEVGAPLGLSDIGALSDYEYHIDQVPIDVWSESPAAWGLAWGDVDLGSAITDTVYPAPHFRGAALYADVVDGLYAAVSSADGMVVYAVDGGNTIRVSDDAGATWGTHTPSGYVGGGHALTCSGSGAVALVRDVGQFFFTANSGTTWTKVADLASQQVVARGFCVSQDGTFLAVSARVTAGGAPGLIASTNGGSSWSFVATPAEWADLACSADGDTLLALTDTSAVWLSTDAGASWDDITADVTPSGYIEGLAVSADGDVLMVGGEYGVRLSTDGGASWGRVGDLAHVSACALSANGGVLMAALWDGAYLSSDGGATWTLAAPGYGADAVEVVTAGTVAAYVGDMAGWRFWPSSAIRLPYLTMP